MACFDAIIVAIITGCFPILALLLSKFSGLINKKNERSVSSAYECGFEKKDNNFQYIGNMVIITLSIIIELIVVLLFLCCMFNIQSLTLYGKVCARILLSILIISIILSYKCLAKDLKKRRPFFTA
ncbi:MAG: NADH-quinone oxidoreductase subunit A [Holosporales bacterium]|jgi:NADH:ubiquinone oxidoreductase subunit 3 (subunit A)|nr:NADH-quinone oxidoreductase subunit A [Holosporales bacterium]